MKSDKEFNELRVAISNINEVLYGEDYEVPALSIITDSYSTKKVKKVEIYS